MEKESRKSDPLLLEAGTEQTPASTLQRNKMPRGVYTYTYTPFPLFTLTCCSSGTVRGRRVRERGVPFTAAGPVSTTLFPSPSSFLGASAANVRRLLHCILVKKTCFEMKLFIFLQNITGSSLCLCLRIRISIIILTRIRPRPYPSFRFSSRPLSIPSSSSSSPPV